MKISKIVKTAVKVGTVAGSTYKMIKTFKSDDYSSFGEREHSEYCNSSSNNRGRANEQNEEILGLIKKLFKK